MPSWRDRIQNDDSSQKSTGSWRDRIQDEPTPSSNTEQPTRTPNTSMLEVALSGGAEGLTLGFDDELVGAGGAGVDLASDIGSGSELSLDKLLNSYRTSRDRRREQKAQQTADRPGTMLASNIAGGVLPMLFTGGTGALAAGAKALAPTTLKGMALLGGAAGAGTSQADLTKGEVGQLALDTGMGAGLGTVLGKIAPKAGSVPLKTGALGAGIGGASALLDEEATGEDVLNRILSGGLIGAGVGLAGKPILDAAKKTIKGVAKPILGPGMKAYEMANTPVGQPGVDVTSPEFQRGFIDDAKSMADEAAEVISGVKAKDAASSQKIQDVFEQQKQDTIQNFSKQVDDLNTKQSQYLEAEELKHRNLKESEFKTLVKTQTELANSIDQDLSKIESQVIKDLNTVYESADGKGLAINTSTAIEDFIKSVPDAALSKKTIEKLNSYSGDVPLSKLRELKNDLYPYMGSMDKNVARAARDTYFNLSNDAITQLQNMNEGTLADALKLNNRKFKLLQDFNENFISFKDQGTGASPSIKVLKDYATKESMPKTLTGSAATTQATASSKISELMNSLQKFNPEMAQNLEMAGNQISSQTKSLEAPFIPPANPNEVKIAELKQMMERTKQLKAPEVKEGELFQQFKSDSPDDIANKFMTYIEKSANKDNQFEVQRNVDKFFNDIETTKGPEFKAQIEAKMKDLAEKRELYMPEFKATDVFTVPGIGRTFAKGQAYVGAKAGKVVKGVTEAINKPTALITDATNKITDDLISRVSTTDANLGNILKNIKQMPPEKQQRAMFAIMQNPVYRNKINQAEEKK